MNLRSLLMTTILTTGLTLSVTTAPFAADNITTGTVKTATTPITKAEIADPRVAASGFVEHVNFARVALAMKNVDLARQHIGQARSMVNLIKSTSEDARRITKVTSDRVEYGYDTEYKYHYFPVQTGPVQVKHVDNGPIWAKNDLAVTDADIVYLTLDLTGDKTENYLTAADKAITAGDLKEAGSQLAQLTNAVVSVDSQIAVPSDKAHDNLALDRNFIAGNNYAGARYALNHADDALDEMQRDDTYKVHRNDIIAMRKDVSDMQTYITKKDPDMIDKADAKLSSWWDQMQTWSEKPAK